MLNHCLAILDTKNVKNNECPYLAQDNQGSAGFRPWDKEGPGHPDP